MARCLVAKRPTKRRNPFVQRSEIEFLLPLDYNDGTPIEEEKHLQTRDELLSRFGGCRVTTSARAAYEGLWEHTGHLYHDFVKSLIVECRLRNADYYWLSTYKRQLEKRFKQVEIYIIVRDIKRII